MGQGFAKQWHFLLTFTKGIFILPQKMQVWQEGQGGARSQHWLSGPGPGRPRLSRLTPRGRYSPGPADAVRPHGGPRP